MPRVITLLCLAVLLSSCGGSSNSISTSDVIQFRKILDEDPLAVSLTMDDGRTVVAGDVLFTDTGVLRTAVRENETGTFDLELTLDERICVRMKKFWEGRRADREVLVLKSGTPWRIVTGANMISETKMVIEDAGATEDAVASLGDSITLWKQRKK